MGGLSLVLVRGPSMQPTLRDGDRLVVRRGGRIRLGDLVLARMPARPGSADRVTVVKRAVHREPAAWWLERDNRATGIDSWHVGPIPDDDVLGVVLLRCWPRPRRFRPAPP